MAPSRVFPAKSELRDFLHKLLVGGILDDSQFATTDLVLRFAGNEFAAEDNLPAIL
jgi:hypothetical protein